MKRFVTIKNVAATLFVLSTGTITSAITPGQAEDQGFLTRLGLDFGHTRPVETPETRLSGELTTCLQLAVGLANGPSIGFTVDLDRDGQLVRDPQLAVSSVSAEASMGQLENAAVAVANCLPLHLGADPLRQTRLTLVLDRGQIAYIDRAQLFDAPAPLAPEFAETHLALGTDQTRELQQRLKAAGFDPGSADGVIGPKTRRAIADWQIARDLAETGFLDAEQLALIHQDTEDAFKKAAASKKSKRRYTKFVRTADGCVRYRKSGKIVPHQNFKCDARGMIESF